MDIGASWLTMQRSLHNLGQQGLAACAISAVDTALRDLKAKLLGQPLARPLGGVRDLRYLVSEQPGTVNA
jgi:L-alanine-DL-glutamate epimerase-like enolase superfamily enzyme